MSGANPGAIGQSRQRSKIALIGCGGTISSLGANSLDVIDYPEFGKKLEIDEVVARVPELDDVAELVLVPYRAASSTALDIPDLMAIRRAIHQVFLEKPRLAGIVVLHGTASLEETAFFLHLTVNDPRPVVLVGAQRPLNAIGSDAPRNLVNALRVAAAPESVGRGVLIVLNDEINSARDTVKCSNYRLHAFRSTDYGLLGQVDGDRVVYARRIDGVHTVSSPLARLPPHSEAGRVDILYSYLGADEVLIDASVAAGARGLVCAAFAPGLLSPQMKVALRKYASEGFPIIIASRANSGRVIPRRWLLENGLLASEGLSPQKARLVLLLGLMMGWRRRDFATLLPTI